MFRRRLSRESGLERTGVKVGRFWGAHPSNVAQKLREFEEKLQAAVSRFEQALPIRKDLSGDDVDAAYQCQLAIVSLSSV